MILSVLLAAAAAAVGATVLAHLLSRGSPTRVLVGLARLVPPSTSRRLRLGPLREPLTLLVRLALLLAALAWCFRVAFAPMSVPASGSGGAREAVSALARAADPARSGVPLPSPAFAAVPLRPSIEAVVIGATGREGTVVAPDADGLRWTPVPVPAPPPLRVRVVHEAARAADADHVVAALRSLPPERGIVLEERCARACAGDAPVDVALLLGAVPDEAARAAARVLRDGEAGGTGALARTTPDGWRWDARLHPASDPLVASASFPEQLARVLERVASGGQPAVSPARDDGPWPAPWLAGLVLALWLAERTLAARERASQAGADGAATEAAGRAPEPAR